VGLSFLDASAVVTESGKNGNMAPKITDGVDVAKDQFSG
jgi:hypothetical protein